MVYASISLNCFLLYLPARRLLAAVQVLPVRTGRRRPSSDRPS